jgi:hypothetical protein
LGLLITIILLTIAGLGAIFMAAFMRLWKSPPVIRIEVNAPLVIPPEFKLVLQKQPANIETDKPTEIPIPGDIMLYISQESDEWAQDGRKKRARALYADVKNWPVVFQLMRQEDGELEQV